MKCESEKCRCGAPAKYRVQICQYEEHDIYGTTVIERKEIKNVFLNVVSRTFYCYKHYKKMRNMEKIKRVI